MALGTADAEMMDLNDGIVMRSAVVLVIGSDFILMVYSFDALVMSFTVVLLHFFFVLILEDSTIST